MSITPLPVLDRFSPTFRADVDTFFETQLPIFTQEISAEIAGVEAARDAAEQAVADAEAVRDNAVSLVESARDEAVDAVTVARNTALSDMGEIRDQTADYRDAAAASAQAANNISHFVGRWDLLTGALDVPATTYHSGSYWALLESVADVTAHEPGVSGVWAASRQPVPVIRYEDRADLRTTAGSDGDLYLVDELGLFRFATGASEPDDDETCFSTGTGCWLMECPHWDFVEAWREPDRDLQERRIDGAEELAEDALEQANALTAFQGKFIRSSITSAITTVAATAQVTFSGTVAGAAVGDLVVVTPPNNSGSGQISFYARVTATNTVAVYINNPSATSATLTPGAWQILVVKQ